MIKKLCFDIGGTKTAIGLFEGFELVGHASIPTRDFQSTLDQVAGTAKEMLPTPPDVIGVSCTGPLDLAAGTVLNDDTLKGWMGRPLKEAVKGLCRAPIALMNDADAALLGEVSLGALKNRPGAKAVMLIFGTGVGGAIWDGEKVFVGAFGEHPEIGHLLVRTGGPRCYCGASGCLEAMTSGPAIDEDARYHGLPGVEELAELCRRKDPQALDLVGGKREIIAEALWTLTHTVRPEAFVLGGGVMDSLFDWLAPKQIRVTPTTVPGPAPEILRAELGNRAGLYGAAVAAEDLLRHS